MSAQIASGSENPIEPLLTSVDMARIYRCTVDAFISRWQREKRKPRELRVIPDPIEGGGPGGKALLWSPKHVRASTTGGPVWVRK